MKTKPPNHKLRRLQFGLLTLFVVVTIAGGSFGFFNWAFGPEVKQIAFDSAASKKAEPTAIGKILDAASEIGRGIFDEAFPELEKDFIERVLVPVIASSKTPNGRDELYSRWMLDGEELPDAGKLRLVTTTDVFYGTVTKLSHYDASVVHELVAARGQDPATTAVLRFPISDGVPTALLLAVVAVEHGGTTTYYAAEKIFDYRDARWRIKSSRINPSSR